MGLGSRLIVRTETGSGADVRSYAVKRRACDWSVAVSLCDWRTAPISKRSASDMYGAAPFCNAVWTKLVKKPRLASTSISSHDASLGNARCCVPLERLHSKRRCSLPSSPAFEFLGPCKEGQRLPFELRT